jgi:hypothetical protein
MIQNNVISFDKKSIAQPKGNTKKPKRISCRITNKVDLKIIERSAQSFMESIILGDLYQELKPKDSLPKNNISRL